MFDEGKTVMLTPATITIMVGTIVLALYFLVRVLCKPKEGFGSKPYVEFFYAEWCGHCKKFMPTWEKVAADLSGEAEFKKFNSDDKDVKELMTKYSVKGFPHVQKTVDGETTEFKGSRTEQNLVQFVKGEAASRENA